MAPFVYSLIEKLGGFPGVLHNFTYSSKTQGNDLF